MASVGKIAKIGGLAAIAFAGLTASKWYHTAAMEAIDPKRGIYGMEGLEIWIDINARMPAFAREWGCNTLREREKAVLGGSNSMAPYSCQPGFDEGPERSSYEVVVDANLGQAIAGMDPERAAAVRKCFDARMAVAVTPEDIAAVNEDAASDVMSKVVLAVNDAARECKAEAGG